MGSQSTDARERAITILSGRPSAVEQRHSALEKGSAGEWESNRSACFGLIYHRSPEPGKRVISSTRAGGA